MNFPDPPQFTMPMLDIPQSRPKRWSERFMTQVENDDSLWSDYLKKANDFDKRLVDDLNQIVDVILVYVTLFIAVLNTFVIETSKNFSRDPRDISNDLLNATYHLMVAQYNNISTPPAIDTNSFLQLDEATYKRAVISNALLYTALALCTVVSVIALAAKLWLVSYSDRTFNLVGLPYDRSVERQQTYNGVLAWKMRTVINTLPLILLIAVIMFGFYIHIAALALDITIGYAVAVVITLGFVSLAITSLAAAFIPECPFYSPFSAIIKNIFEFLRKYITWGKGHRLWLPITLCVATGAGIAYGTLKYSENIIALVFIPLTITFSYAMEDKDDEGKNDEGKKKKDPRRPQKYRLPQFALGGFVVIGSILAAAGYFNSSLKIFVILYCVGMLALFVVGWEARKLAKSSKKTRVIDAMAWLLNSESTPSKIEPLLQRIGQITVDNDKEGHNHYRARLLESLMPLFSSLITSPRTKMLYEDSQLKDLETYVSCLAQLSDFQDDDIWNRSNWKLLIHLREDAKGHPILEDSLRNKLVELIKDSRSNNLTEVAGVVLSNFGFDECGGELKAPSRWLRMTRRQQFEVSGDVSSTITLNEPTHPFCEAKGPGYKMLNAV